MAVPQIGIAAGGGWPSGASDDQVRRDLDGMAAIGFRFLRYGVNWPAIESTEKGRYWLQRSIQIAGWAKERSIRSLGVMGYTSRYYVDTSVPESHGRAMAPPPPQHYEAWRNYCRALFTALVPLGVLHYEPWNEPNHNFFWYNPRPQVFKELARIAREEAVKVNPNIKLVCGATAPAPMKLLGAARRLDPATPYDPAKRYEEIRPPQFIDALYDEGIKPYLGAVSCHPYTGTDEPDAHGQHWYTMTDQYDAILATMRANGHGTKKIWGTEFGYRTDKVSEAEQARLLVRQIEVWRQRPNAGVGFVFNWSDADSPEGVYGLHRRDGSAKPAVSALRSALT